MPKLELAAVSASEGNTIPTDIHLPIAMKQEKFKQMRDNPALAAKWIAIAFTSLVGAWMRIPHSVQILLMVMGLDVFSGLCAAAATKSLNSSIMFRGLMGKLAVFPLLAMLHLIEKPLSLPFEFESVAAFAFIAYESMSIIENCANARVPIPAVIVETLAKAKVRTASPDEIHEAFGDRTTVSVGKSTEILKTPSGQPDLKVETKITTMEEKHIEPIPPVSQNETSAS